MSHLRTRSLIALSGGIAATALLVGLYLIIVMIGGAQDPLGLAWERRMSILPLSAGFGIQVALYVLLRGAYSNPLQVLTGRATTGASGGMSTLGMVACCVSSLPNLLPLLGITPLAPFVAQWSTPLMMAGVAVNGLGIASMAYSLLKQRKQLRRLAPRMTPAEVS
jgi:hypothetical protein